MKKLGLAIFAYVLIFGALAIWRWQEWTYGTDTGIFTQAVHTTLTGFINAPEEGTHFRFHWSPILGVLLPFLSIGRSGLVLQFAQVVLIAATALPLYGLASAYVSSSRAFAYACLALVYPPLCAVAFMEFHEIAFYPVLALAIMWAADRGRWRWFGVFAIAGALVREDSCIILAIVGAVLALIGFVHRNASTVEGGGLLVGQPKQPRRLFIAGLGLTVINLSALFIYFRIVVPSIGPWEPSSHFYEYSFAHGPAQVVIALILHPQYIFKLMNLGRLKYLIEALAPLAFLPLFSRWSLLALPGLLIVMLASTWIVWHMGSHYPALWAPYFLLGSVAALIRLQHWTRLYGLSLVTSAIILVAFNPMRVTYFIRPGYIHADAVRAFDSLPPDARIVTHYDWLAPIAFEKPNASVYFCPSTRFAVYDDSYLRDDYPNGYFRDAIRSEIRRELASGQMHKQAAFGSVTVYLRVQGKKIQTTRCNHIGDAKYTTLTAALSTK